MSDEIKKCVFCEKNKPSEDSLNDKYLKDGR
jgi:hypothetical protein